MRKIVDFIKSLFHRLTVITLLFVTLCIVIPTVIFIRGVYVYSIERFEKTLIKTIQTETSSYAGLLEQEFQAISLQSYSLLSDNTESTVRVKFEMGVQNTTFASQLLELQSHMESIKNCHNIINDIVLYYPGVSRKVSISSQALYSVENENIDEIVNNSSERNIWNDSDNIVCWDGEGLGIRPQYEDINVILASKISRKSMKNYLSTFKTNKNASFAVCTGEDTGEIFFVATDSMFRREYVPENLKAGSYRVIDIEGEKYLLTCAELDIDMRFYQLVSFDYISMTLDEHKSIMNLFTAALLCLAAVFIVLFYLIIHKPIEHARQTFQRMENGELGVQMGKSWYVEFQGMYNQFDSMSKHIQYLIEQEYELRLLNTKAEMKQLQYQISPHFLYNTYFTLRGLLQEEDYESAEQMAGIVGKYLKYITVSGDETATLDAELEHARAYGQIQQIRFSRRISICFAECPAELKQIRIPRLIVQPLIENAFEHGVKDCLEGGRIQVDIKGTPDQISILVEDNGTALSEEKLQELQELLKNKEKSSGDSVALLNIHRRLVMQYGENSGLFVSKSELGGLRCELRIITKMTGGITGAQDSGS